ncbi:MAG: ABC transporter permease [Defluviitaleaceae bacterium]|nr:ABC transporter permease [Defluviitaleaceae bacterium]
MKILDIITMAIRNMTKRKLRTGFTVLGVAIGAAAITLMISLGLAVNLNFEEQIEAMGPRALRMRIWSNWQPEPGQIYDLTDDVVAQINALPNVRIATPFVQFWDMNFLSGPYLGRWITIIGMKPEALELFGFEFAEGGSFDISSDEWQIVFGSDVEHRFQNPRQQGGGGMGGGMFFSGMRPPMGGGGSGPPSNVDLMNAPLTAHYHHSFGTPPPIGGAPPGQGDGAGNIRPYVFRPMGILVAGDDWQTRENAFMPLHQVQELIAARERDGGGSMFISGPSFTIDQDGNMIQLRQPEGHERLEVLIDHPASIRRVLDDLEAMGINPGTIDHEARWILMQNETQAGLRTLLTAMGGVALGIAALFIMTIMFMSIYERTKEIGVMKVIGASVKDIRRLFLFEAAFIGAIGGAVGIGFSALLSWIFNNLEDFALFETGMPWMEQQAGLVSFIPSWLYILAITASVGVGIVSGLWPAIRATRISALAAIRTD